MKPFYTTFIKNQYNLRNAVAPVHAPLFQSNVRILNLNGMANQKRM